LRNKQPQTAGEAAAARGAIENPKSAARRLSAAMDRSRCCSS
jgi:hypothetical protein